MVNNFVDVVGSVLYILNTYVPEEYAGTRVGSYFFKGDQQLVFTKYMPKGQVTEDTLDISNKGFGRVPHRDEYYRINVRYFVKEGDTGSTSGYKNRELLYYQIGQIKNKLLTHSGSLGCNDMTFNTVDRPVYIPEQRVYVGTLPVIFKARKET